MALFSFQSERQNQPRALPLHPFRRDSHFGDQVRTQGLAGSRMESVRPACRVRSAIPRGVLRRRLPLVCRTFRTDDEFGITVPASLCERDGHSDHDGGGLLHLLVETTGQAAPQAWQTSTGWLIGSKQQLSNRRRSLFLVLEA